MALSLFVKKDFEHRYAALKVANPICAALFFAWSLGITYSDALANGAVDPTVFMTFSSSVPLIFYLFPVVYVGIALLSDLFMLYLIFSVTGSAAALINIAIFFVFQLVLGMGFLRMKTSLSELIVDEHEKAEIDAMTGFFNRRAYESDVKEYAATAPKEDFVYLSIDVNGLKEVNDTYGHEAGDELIRGAAACMALCFGGSGKLYRMGGDEFAALLFADGDRLERMRQDFARRMSEWSQEHGRTLVAACGAASAAEFPGKRIEELAKLADERMYAEKEEYYTSTGKDRRSR